MSFQVGTETVCSTLSDVFCLFVCVSALGSSIEFDEQWLKTTATYFIAFQYDWSNTIADIIWKMTDKISFYQYNCNG